MLQELSLNNDNRKNEDIKDWEGLTLGIVRRRIKLHLVSYYLRNQIRIILQKVFFT
jgi:hypothetical protein